MRTLLAVVALMALTAHAVAAPARYWHSVDCEAHLTINNGVFSFYTNDGNGLYCRIENWPLDSATAKMSCDDTKGATIKADMVLASTEGPLEFLGTTLYPVGGGKVRCPGDQERDDDF